MKTYSGPQIEKMEQREAIGIEGDPSPRRARGLTHEAFAKELCFGADYVIVHDADIGTGESRWSLRWCKPGVSLPAEPLVWGYSPDELRAKLHAMLKALDKPYLRIPIEVQMITERH